MDGVLTFEFEPAFESNPCAESGHISVYFTRFVYRDGDAFAITKLVVPKNVTGAYGLVSATLGDWSEEAENESRIAFLMQVRSVPGRYEFSVLDSEYSPWAENKVLGLLLTREKALAHPWLADAYAVLGKLFEVDTEFTDLLVRASISADLES
jgi:hypothetical protein